VGVISGAVGWKALDREMLCIIARTHMKLGATGDSETMKHQSKSGSVAKCRWLCLGGVGGGAMLAIWRSCRWPGGSQRWPGQRHQRSMSPSASINGEKSALSAIMAAALMTVGVKLYRALSRCQHSALSRLHLSLRAASITAAS